MAAADSRRDRVQAMLAAYTASYASPRADFAMQARSLLKACARLSSCLWDEMLACRELFGKARQMCDHSVQRAFIVKPSP